MQLYEVSSTRTNNFNDEQMMEKMKTIWKEAYLNLEQYEGSIYGVYYNYDGNYKDDYSVSVAIENNNGKSFIEIPKSEKYKIFPVDATDKQGIIKAWSEIWEQEEAGVLKRAYSYDFEKYYHDEKLKFT